jgi:predicted ester cyclase
MTHKETTDMSAKQNKAIARRLFKAVAINDQAALEELLAPEFVAHQRGISVLQPVDELTREAFMQGIRMHSARFSDQHYTIEDQLAEGDKVMTRVAWRATHTGEFQGLSPTGKKVVGGGIAIERIKDGKIVERWAQPDRLGLMQQLGLLPGPDRG